MDYPERALTELERAYVKKILEAGTGLNKLLTEIKGAGLELDTRWLQIGVTNLQQGLMAWQRAVTKPKSF